MDWIGRFETNNTTASQPDKNYKYEGDYVEYKGKLYFVSLAEERVEFVRNVKEEAKN